MSALRAESSGLDAWSPRPGEPVMLRLDADGAGLPVRITSRRVQPARETRLQKALRTPTIWGGALASLAVFVLVSTAFATGTVRPAPPTLPTPRPGEPTPTPDTRPALSIGGFVLQPPLQPTPVPPSLPPGEVQEPAQSALPLDGVDVAGEQSSSPLAEPTPSPCTNLFGIGCSAAPPPPSRPVPPRQAPQPTQPSTGTNQLVIPIASPAARPDPLLGELQAANVGPPRGSALESALQTASAADENFAREVEPATVQDETLPKPSNTSSTGSGK
jgi:hypothetical protein